MFRDFLKNTNVKFFPPDFFEQKEEEPKKKENKKIIIDLAKEEEEDKELIELLEGNKTKNNDAVKNNKIDDKNNYINNIKKNFKINNEINMKKNESNIFDLNIKDNIYKKIDRNYYSNRNMSNNNIISKKKASENNKMIILNKQKVISANTSSINSHVSRLLNLKKLKSQKNMYNKGKNTLIGQFNKGTKYISAFNRVNKNNDELNNFKMNHNNSLKHTYSTGKEKFYNSKYNIQYNKNSNDNSINNISYIKKYTSNSIKSQSITEDKNNKFRVGLLSAFSNSSKNILIPLVSLQRPLSNFNIGAQFNIKNINKEKNSPEIKQIKLNLMRKNKEEIRQKINTAPTRKREENNYLNNMSNEEQKKIMDIKYNNLYGKMNNNIYGHKFHHIKIDRSLINKKMRESLYKSNILNYMNLGQNKFPKIKNKYKYNEVKRILNINNSTKN